MYGFFSHFLLLIRTLTLVKIFFFKGEKNGRSPHYGFHVYVMWEGAASPVGKAAAEGRGRSWSHDIWFRSAVGSAPREQGSDAISLVIAIGSWIYVKCTHTAPTWLIFFGLIPPLKKINMVGGGHGGVGRNHGRNHFGGVAFFGGIKK